MVNYHRPSHNCENTFQVTIHKMKEPQKLPHTYTVLIVVLMIRTKCDWACENQPCECKKIADF